ncbi:protein TolR [Zavarzinia compransoris]|uniref:Protein TolR n=1 Tax=Zavarzinia compransoris TaxID=1264899 RepID=A0A317E5U2_9PROT|nr:protein TolR [Zavarzinia compransoris]PWR20733.1 protein TolR [Zavarzinia compransoris]TDP44434.1 cell division and transport-associated protein TolR [Zavarzinia compransoris]
MGASLGGGGGRRGGRRGRAPMGEINVTPLVDVMLVLLIVFMVAAPLMTVGVPVDLPTTQADTMPQDDKPVIVSVDAEGKVFIGDTPSSVDTLVADLQAAAKKGPETRIYVRGDQAINYGKVMETMGKIKAAGFTKVALIALPPAK